MDDLFANSSENSSSGQIFQLSRRGEKSLCNWMVGYVIFLFHFLKEGFICGIES
jgi:hypothetical protein